MSDATKLSHYMNYPVCGYCTNAWDVIYGRKRSRTSPMQWVSYCKVGGCDPDVWDHIDEGTGWPPGWKLADNGLPLGYSKSNKPLKIPATDDRVYHRRASDDPKAPWRNITNKLRREWGEKVAKKKGLTADEIDWEDDDLQELVAADLLARDSVVEDDVDLDDPDMWE
jgi:hypothetical protein